MNHIPKSTISDETKTEAMRLAKATQKPGQTKEQTKLVIQGIQKGIDQYKKQQKTKARETDRLRKKLKPVSSALLDIQSDNSLQSQPDSQQTISSGNKLPWVLLGLSWLLFAGYQFLNNFIS
ncbi:DUF2956 domain-containing protein [Neptunomonas antarctica]|uniref:DUF2956 domain-containing protein n=1 Tax=Neptunomonas antarctica TaxID=619304 RepID=A0A1N7KGH8_9GAMM|nr:DUF2956 domain-containing protein [Neptunomonas antarctica]SIS60574.1 Protein of unknown function [Neptunomonas antarctica]